MSLGYQCTCSHTAGNAVSYPHKSGCPFYVPQATYPVSATHYTFTPNRSLTDEDVERVAKRVVELLKAEKP